MLRGLLLVPMFASLARADELDAPIAPPSSIAPLQQPGQPQLEVVHTSYRNQILVADALSIGATLSFYGTRDGGTDNAAATMLILGVAGGEFATPIIHAVHGHGTRALGSYFLRAGLMTAGLVIAAESGPLDCSQGSGCGLDNIPAGLAIGIAAASLFDMAYFSDDVEVRPVTARTWSPIVAPQRGGAQLGIAATF